MCKNLNILEVSKYCFFWFMIVLIIVQGCDKEEKPEPEPEPEPTEIQYQIVNEWIFDHMEVYYYWNTQIPKNLSKSLKPDEYFESLLSKEDRFSVIYDNFQELYESLMGVNTEAGYDYMLLRLSGGSDIMGYITYIKPKTPAEAAGLKRGDFFLRINNTQLTINNYRTLLQETTKRHTLGLAKIEGNTIYPTDNVDLSVIVYEENPILLDTVYYDNNRKIGYFVYNFFARDSEENGIRYERELNELFGKYKTEGIDDLIIDLRYNSGGTTVKAQALASMISGLSSTDIFGYTEYNSYLHSHWSVSDGANYNVMYFLDEIVRAPNDKTPINKLSGLNRLYLIVSGQTASASELLINGLRPYMGAENVVLVGETTFGKNVGSFLLYERDSEKQKTNNWGMLPIVFKLSNKLHFSNYSNGFEPDVDIHETDDLLYMKPLGDTEELLLATTLDMISGISKMRKQDIGVKFEIVGSAIDRMPARKNMYIYDRKNSLFGRD